MAKMREQRAGRAGRIAVVLAVLTWVLAWSAALVAYLRSGRIEVTPIAAGVVIPLVIIGARRSQP